MWFAPLAFVTKVHRAFCQLRAATPQTPEAGLGNSPVGPLAMAYCKPDLTSDGHLLLAKLYAVSIAAWCLASTVLPPCVMLPTK